LLVVAPGGRGGKIKTVDAANGTKITNGKHEKTRAVKRCFSLKEKTARERRTSRRR